MTQNARDADRSAAATSKRLRSLALTWPSQQSNIERAARVLRNVEQNSHRCECRHERRSTVRNKRQRNSFCRHERKHDTDIKERLGHDARNDSQDSATFQIGPAPATLCERRARETSANTATTASAPTSPSSSPTTAKIKSECANGRNSIFCLPCAKPSPFVPPDPIAISDCTT